MPRTFSHRLGRFLACCGVVACVLAGAFAEEPIPPREVKPDEAKKKADPVPKKSEEDPEVDVQQTAERIAENARKAGDRLKEKDPGADTRQIQKEILKDIDTLLKKAQEPPPPPDMPPPMPPDMPPPKDGMPPPMGGMPPPMGGKSEPKGGTPMPKGGPSGMQPMPPPKSGSSGERPRRERKPRGGSPMPGMGEPKETGPMPRGEQPKGTGQPESKKDEPGKERPDGEAKKDPKDGKDGFGKPSPRRENDKLADLYKDVWGHLPERLRQEMDLYYREQFMPRYSELLKQYYSALAEQRKKAGDGK